MQYILNAHIKRSTLLTPFKFSVFFFFFLTVENFYCEVCEKGLFFPPTPASQSGSCTPKLFF